MSCQGRILMVILHFLIILFWPLILQFERNLDQMHLDHLVEINT